MFVDLPNSLFMKESYSINFWRGPFFYSAVLSYIFDLQMNFLSKFKLMNCYAIPDLCSKNNFLGDSI